MARVAVLRGGVSPERPVSLSSAAGVSAALRRRAYDVVDIDPQDGDWIDQLRAVGPDAVFNALHGPDGEDGKIQGVLEALHLPYTHSGVLASALAMDKDKSRAIFAQANLPIAAGKLINRYDAAQAHAMPLPYVVKPNAQGSSVGIFIVRDGANTPPQELADPNWAFGDDVLVEEFVDGLELTVAVLGEPQGPRALTVTEIVPAGDWYDYESKYAAGGSRHVLPAQIPHALARDLMRWSEEAHAVLGCRGVTRADFRHDPATGKTALLEVNTQPGMTPTSLAPEQALHVGMSYDDLVEWMIKDASWPR